MCHFLVYIDEVLTMERGGQSYYYHQNALWSVEAITDSGENVVERVAYDAYGAATITNAAGVPVPLNVWGAPHSAIGNPWLFTGRQLDEEAGLYYYRARYYDGGKGRFLQRDPLGYEDGMNLYEYARSSPINFVDPSGLDPPFDEFFGTWHHVFPEWFVGKNKWLFIYIDHYTHVLLDTGTSSVLSFRSLRDRFGWSAGFFAPLVYIRHSLSSGTSMLEGWALTGRFPIKVGAGGAVAALAVTATALSVARIVESRSEVSAIVGAARPEGSVCATCKGQSGKTWQYSESAWGGTTAENLAKNAATADCNSRTGLCRGVCSGTQRCLPTYTYDEMVEVDLPWYQDISGRGATYLGYYCVCRCR